MNTPILDFLEKYSLSNSVRLHMPGHKGKTCGTKMDITEINGADSLFDANGIIDESEKNLSFLYNTLFSLYSTEGSTLAIKTMLALIFKYAKNIGEKPLILAQRNVHSSFLYGVGLLGVEVEWIEAERRNLFSSTLNAKMVEEKLRAMQIKPTALYLTSPDYLGNILPIKEIAKVCKKHNVLLAVDNAHGAYFNFLENNIHPINLGADMCSDSAHKTLPTLTGGAYLHINKNFTYFSKHEVKRIMKTFASTSPSYLILSSLDSTNKYLFENKNAFNECAKKVDKIKEYCVLLGFNLVGEEKLKITLDCKSFGYFGNELSLILEQNNIAVEYADKDFVVLMFSPLNTDEDYSRLKNVLSKIERKKVIEEPILTFTKPKRKMSIKDALFESEEKVKIEDAKGRIISSISVSCPPAIPLIFSGEVVDENVIKIMEYYDIKECYVVKE